MMTGLTTNLFLSHPTLHGSQPEHRSEKINGLGLLTLPNKLRLFFLPTGVGGQISSPFTPKIMQDAVELDNGTGEQSRMRSAP